MADFLYPAAFEIVGISILEINKRATFLSFSAIVMHSLNYTFP